MKQISTGAGLVALSVGMVATAFIATRHSGSEAFAQGTGGERRIVYTNLITSGPSNALLAYRIWSDNSIDIRAIGLPVWEYLNCLGNGGSVGNLQGLFMKVPSSNPGGTCTGIPNGGTWQTFDNGTSGFRPLTDVDMSGETDAGDISQVLLDFNTRSEDLPPPPIDCTINAPR